ncbi:MAG TPA: MG2 domain-containing protein [Nitrospirota bacterium]|nr:MG2 domain-containing protein [Nitrospirota bacterium]
MQTAVPGERRGETVWGKGIESASGVATTQDQALAYKAREAFLARFTCDRENPQAGCIPFLPMRVDFTAPVSWDYAGRIVMKGPGGSVYKPYLKEETEGKKTPEAVYSVTFMGPFPETAAFVIDLPKNIKDDADRHLSNIDKFPLTIKTGPYPPLAKFSARFGIIEKSDPLLPVTLRNVEQEVKARMTGMAEDRGGLSSIADTAKKIGGALSSILPAKDETKISGEVKGKTRQISSDVEIIKWLRLVSSADRRQSLFREAPEKQTTREFAVPKPNGAKAFEVVGIPLNNGGFYVVELESRILGESLLGAPQPLYVPASALVTNLAAHFKWGRESSLVWVTTLDKAEPVADASVVLRDCEGAVHWEGKTDKNGIALIKKELPSQEELPRCESHGSEESWLDSSQNEALSAMGSGLFVFARAGGDMTFAHSSWVKGIETWRYNLPWASHNGPVIAHTIMDRTLLRAGETVSMKHIIRKHTMAGFSDAKPLPQAVVIRHEGSDQRYEMPLLWDKNGIAETVWKIPQEAKLGEYSVFLMQKASGKEKKRTAVGGYEEGDEEYLNAGGWTSGSFRVEEFRVPLMKGIIQPPKEPLVHAAEANVDLFLKYLSGGGASGAAVKFRAQEMPKYVSFADYEEFQFANGEVKEGVVKRSTANEYDEGPGQEGTAKKEWSQSGELALDQAGSLRTKLVNLPKIALPRDIAMEMEFRDPNGEVQTVSGAVALWPSNLIVGIKPDSWAASKEAFKFHVIVLDLAGKPVPNKEVSAELYQRIVYSHRKRLVGGFYAYDHVTETKKIARFCEGKTNDKGLLICEAQSPVSGNVIVQARVFDNAGNVSVANRDIWIAGKGEWWFDVSDNDRIDLLPEKKRYEPGETAKFQVRMPFREAAALVTVEREGVIESFTTKLSGKAPVVEIPVKGTYAPNVFVSVLCLRGRVGDSKPTAMVDLAKPAYKLGIAEINVGWRAHELRVIVLPERQVYKIRDKANVQIKVRTRDRNNPWPPKGTEIAVAAVDEGLLQLMPNRSWNLLEAMMGRRGYEIQTATAQMQVVGKRHYGIKAFPAGGGGGRQATREMFDTLLLWKSRVVLDQNGEARIAIPLNDSLTSFRIVAVANGDTGLFGTGDASIRTTQDIMILAGLPPLVREGDRFRAGFTIRNTSERAMDIEISAKSTSGLPLPPLTEPLNPGEAREIGWDASAPTGVEALTWEVTAQEKNGAAADRLKIAQKVVPAVKVRTYQATITQVDRPLTLAVEKPADALAGKGGINVAFRSKLSNGLGGVTWYMSQYPYTCMEQRTSKAIALRDETMWKKVVADLPAHLDGDGLVKYFPTCTWGSDTLTAYMLSISHEAGWQIPEDVRERMEQGLRGFIEGRVIRWSSLPTADLSIRKMAALEALSRNNNAEPKLLGSITLEPNLWPTSAVIDWMNVLKRVPSIPDRDKRLEETAQIIRSRLNFQGTTMGFSTEKTDYLWWLMVSGDVNSLRTILMLLDVDSWSEDMPRLVRGALGRQYHGAWNTTIANAWGVLAMEKFSKKFESAPVSGLTSASMNEQTRSVDWKAAPAGSSVMLGWPKIKSDLMISHQGTGKPWVTVQSLAAIPLKEPFSSGYAIKKTVTPVEQKKKGAWTRGDVMRVKLDVEAQADMTWVVVNDPVPAGSSILGTGLGGDSRMLTKSEKATGWAWPVFQERSFEAFRAYYEYVPKGKWSFEYTVRLNNAGSFEMPETRVEALYSPEMFGEIPNEKVVVEQ